MRPQQRQRREAAVVEPLPLEIRHIELVRDQAVRHVPRESRVPLDRRELAGAAALVRDPVLVADAEREVRVVIEEERGDVIVENEEQHVRLFLGQPALHGLVTLEDRRPHRVLLLVGIERETDCRSVGRGDTAYDRGHR